MNKEIEKCVKSQDIVGLRYIFADSLDVDPTFVQYREDYEYCRNLPGFWKEHEERTPFVNDQSCWNEDYWVKLKFDLGKNFSQKRFEHMMSVAKIVKAEKIERLNRQRMECMDNKQQKPLEEENREPEWGNREMVPAGTASERQAKRIEEQKRKLEERNRRVAEQERKQKERLSGQGGSVNRNTTNDMGSRSIKDSGNTSTKK